MLQSWQHAPQTKLSLWHAIAIWLPFQLWSSQVTCLESFAQANKLTACAMHARCMVHAKCVCFYAAFLLQTCHLTPICCVFFIWR